MCAKSANHLKKYVVLSVLVKDQFGMWTKAAMTPSHSARRCGIFRHDDMQGILYSLSDVSVPTISKYAVIIVWYLLITLISCNLRQFIRVAYLCVILQNKLYQAEALSYGTHILAIPCNLRVLADLNTIKSQLSLTSIFSNCKYVTGQIIIIIILSTDFICNKSVKHNLRDSLWHDVLDSWSLELAVLNFWVCSWSSYVSDFM
jgi:hypothetical protein